MLSSTEVGDSITTLLIAVTSISCDTYFFQGRRSQTKSIPGRRWHILAVKRTWNCKEGKAEDGCGYY
jgi:hypothetical protein